MRFLIILLLLAGCKDENYNILCTWRNDRKIQSEVFDKCLARAAEARKGSNYSTEDDEDFDEVIAECGRQASIISSYCSSNKANNLATLKE